MEMAFWPVSCTLCPVAESRCPPMELAVEPRLACETEPCLWNGNSVREFGEMGSGEKLSTDMLALWLGSMARSGCPRYG